MLGEGARTAADAERYFNSYASAIEAIGRTADDRPLPDRPGISVKLSALHPRFEALSRERVMAELVPRLIDLARRAKAYDLNFTVDAEEADRLELSLEVIAAAFGDTSLAGWDGFGLAIQAYQKRAAAVIDYTDELAQALNRRMMVRLVKGAYWDTEIKRAQERGLADYPVFTRKAMTDLNYIACAQKLLALRPRLFPQFATHNALTVATVLELADGEGGFEFQRLHGMGEALYAQLSEDRSEPGLPHLCAGRQPPRSPGLSGAAPAGKRRQFVLRGARRRRCGAGGNAAAAPGRHHRHRRKRAHIRTSPAPRSLSAAAAKFARHRIRRPRGVERAACRDRGGNRSCCGGIRDQRPGQRRRRATGCTARSTRPPRSEA